MILDDPFVVLYIEEILIREGILKSANKMSPMDYAIFAIYHELGHWIDFQNRFLELGKDGEQFHYEYSIEKTKQMWNQLVNWQKKKNLVHLNS